MKEIQLLEWRVGALTTKDDPVLRIEGYAVYELASEREAIVLENNGEPFAVYKHVAIKNSIAYVFDLDNQRTTSKLGEVRIYRRDCDAAGNLQLVAVPEA
ncbi:MAG: hypothetical protein V4793_14985 [Paraburkholderia tropica]|uniref:Uncharacterized protein n=1 Tax=Paraburkholderia tropica TaxID=92647 RepID=A0AAQ1JXR1_9BURK|nr:hypothetical protein [Paraburkholderia tropica]MBB2984259.1 hypothetical protein [Paraburkholderia tropica]MBB3005002.1 hypothetical protein [Paraburkholderia tropica]MBB6323290.1 hypothetical protein [Paraburkholderia tropica]PXX05086.1 hypothetical protein C7400_14453 [Paraburkholderia tropica]PZW70514.1 hypothetical protein C7399_14453 [Paraburkholderia tropica]